MSTAAALLGLGCVLVALVGVRCGTWRWGSRADLTLWAVGCEAFCVSQLGLGRWTVAGVACVCACVLAAQAVRAPRLH